MSVTAAGHHAVTAVTVVTTTMRAPAVPLLMAVTAGMYALVLR